MERLQKPRQTKPQNKITGSKGESIAVEYLLQKNIQIIDRNVTSRWGEIDIIAKRDETLVFVEVKTKIGFLKGKPYEAVHYHKLQHLMRAAQFYIMKHNRPETKYAVDVISIILSRSGETVEIQHFDNIQL